ncbi:Glycosyl transferase, group 2 family protein [Candidatus Rhodobacter oscarellae]|uniref:Glycosyl transferase, group 2 family protein n=1 Tax=Candidatus Rhodobacter oscarellae TaxID=1675527 RepID=A0A0J9E443_9RHOB|nr:glycosyltransferase family 2 protein [Candidatus Rhodobacter lobularis]KMW57540.1 Glycosyl transferase, group 2 family protein [Candidatus Rhodobacter lobularis]
MKILLVSTLRDEAPHLLEWVAHHRALGVTDFLLFSNDCSDGTDAMLDALAPLGVVHLVNAPPEGKSLQWNALKQAWAHDLRKAADWVLCIDCDEFINLRPPLASLPDLIGACGEADAIVLPWRLFGHNGHRHLSEALTLELFTRAAPERCNYPVGARLFKTLFKAQGPFRQIGVHRPRLKKGATARWADGSGAPMPEVFALAEQRITLFGLPEATALVQLNHYSVRSAESFMLKRDRGLPNRRGKPIDLTYWVERNFNVVEDTSIHGLLPATKAELARILQLPGLSDLREKAIAHHHAAFEAMMKQEASVKFFGRLLLAASSQPLPRDVINDLVQRYQDSQND